MNAIPASFQAVLDQLDGGVYFGDAQREIITAQPGDERWGHGINLDIDKG